MKISVVRRQSDNINPVVLAVTSAITSARLNRCDITITCCTFKQFDESSVLVHAIPAQYLEPLKSNRHCEIDGIKVTLLNKQKIYSYLGDFTGVIVSLWPLEDTAKGIISSAPNAEEFIFAEWVPNSLGSISDDYPARIILAK